MIFGALSKSVTVISILSEMLSDTLAVIVALPAFSAVITPFLTLTVFGAELFHFIDFSLSVGFPIVSKAVVSVPVIPTFIYVSVLSIDIPLTTSTATVNLSLRVTLPLSLVTIII